MDRSSRLLARSALAAAAGFVILYLGSLLPSGRLAMLCVASVGVIFVRMSCSVSWAAGCFAVTAAAALLLLPGKAMAVLYAAFFGYYPLIRLETERIASLPLRWLVKLAVFNGVFLLLYLLARALFADVLPALSARPLLMFILGNAAFVAYDFALQQMILYYIRKIARRIK